MSKQNATRTDLAYWVALSYFFRGPRLKKLFDYFENGEKAWEASEFNIQTLGFAPETARKFSAWKNEKLLLEAEHLLAKDDVHVTLFGDGEYPQQLLPLIDAPTILFYKGTLPPPSTLLVAIVGTRKATAYGKTVALRLARLLAEHGAGVTSGLARGIDALAHEAALERGGTTVAIIGSGLDRNNLYPREHWKLVENIVAEGGVVISEYPPGVGPEQHHFPERNRIIAGLSRATLVIEAPQKSGALITAFQAIEYGRDVMAVPGMITEPNATGTNRLLKLGAHVIAQENDVLALLNLEPADKKMNAENLSEKEKRVLNLFTSTPLSLDEIATSAQTSTAALLGIVTTLELDGYIKDTGGKQYVRLA